MNSAEDNKKFDKYSSEYKRKEVEVQAESRVRLKSVDKRSVTLGNEGNSEDAIGEWTELDEIPQRLLFKKEHPKTEHSKAKQQHEEVERLSLIAYINKQKAIDSRGKLVTEEKSEERLPSVSIEKDRTPSISEINSEKARQLREKQSQYYKPVLEKEEEKIEKWTPPKYKKQKDFPLVSPISSKLDRQVNKIRELEGELLINPALIKRNSLRFLRKPASIGVIEGHINAFIKKEEGSRRSTQVVPLPQITKSNSKSK